MNSPKLGKNPMLLLQVLKMSIFCRLGKQKTMRDSIHQHVCIIIMGFACLLRFTGYDMATFIVESFLHSAYIRDPSTIVNHAGFYGYTVDLPIYRSWSLVYGTLCLFIFCASFLFINNYLYFISNIILGFGFSLLFTGVSAYQMQFSTKETLARNSARVSGIGGVSLIFGAAVYSFISHSDSTVDNHIEEVNTYRYYSESETRWMYGSFTVSMLLSLLLHCFLPSREVINSVSSINKHKRLSINEQIKMMCSTLIDPSILYLIPCFINHGISYTFFMNIYPTSLQYSSILSNQYPTLTAYYAYSMCLGIILCGVITLPLSKWFNDFGLRPVYFITLITQFVIFTLCVLTVPNWATSHPTDESAVIEPSIIWVLIISFLIGFADTTITTANTVYCSRILPGRAFHVYSTGRFYIGTSAAVLFFVSPSLSMVYHTVIQYAFIILSFFSFLIIGRRINKIESKDNKDSIVKIKSYENDNVPI